MEAFSADTMNLPLSAQQRTGVPALVEDDEAIFPVLADMDPEYEERWSPYELVHAPGTCEHLRYDCYTSICDIEILRNPERRARLRPPSETDAGDYQPYDVDDHKCHGGIQRGRVYSLMSLAARALAPAATWAIVQDLHSELRDLVQRYMPWWRQVDIFDSIREWYDNGQLAHDIGVARISSGSPHEPPEWVLDGEYRTWFPDGTPKAVAYYTRGKQDGFSARYGNRCEERHIYECYCGEKPGPLLGTQWYYYGKKHGVNTGYSDTGSPVAETAYEYGRESPAQRRADEGRTWEQTTVLPDGISVRRMWDENGYLISYSERKRDQWRHGFHLNIIYMRSMEPFGSLLEVYHDGKLLRSNRIHLIPMRTCDPAWEYEPSDEYETNEDQIAYLKIWHELPPHVYEYDRDQPAIGEYLFVQTEVDGHKILHLKALDWFENGGEGKLCAPGREPLRSQYMERALPRYT